MTDQIKIHTIPIADLNAYKAAWQEHLASGGTADTFDPPMSKTSFTKAAKPFVQDKAHELLNGVDIKGMTRRYMSAEIRQALVEWPESMTATAKRFGITGDTVRALRIEAGVFEPISYKPRKGKAT